LCFCSLRVCSTSASAVTMKITTITRNTSVSGVMLISAKRPSLPSSSSPLLASGSFAAIVVLLVAAIAVRGLAGLDVIGGVVVLVGAPRPLRLGVLRGIEQQLEELVGEQLHLGRHAAGAL